VRFTTRSIDLLPFVNKRINEVYIAIKINLIKR